MSSTNELTPTTAAEWKRLKREGFIVTLPSGFVARLQPVSLKDLVRSGRIPDFLTSLVQQVIFVGKTPEELAADPELPKAVDQLYDIVIPAAFISPIVVPSTEEPSEEQLSVLDLDDVDAEVVFNLSTGGTGALRKFRDGQGADVAAIPNGNENGNKAQRTRRRVK